MYRILKIAALTALAFVMAVLPASVGLAQDGEIPIAQGIVNTDEGIGIYAEPSIHSDVVDRRDPGAILMIYEQDGLWVRVGDGWVIASGLDIGPAKVDLQATVDTRSTDMAVRELPTVSSPVVQTLPAGTVVGVLELQDLFAKVYDGEDIGWAFVADLALEEPGADLTDLVQRAGVTTARSTEVALRVAPDIQADTVTTVEADVPVAVLADDESGLFSFVTLQDGTAGWVFNSNLEVNDRVYARGRINAGPTNFREAPDGTAFNRLPFGAEVLLLGQNEDGDWLKVRYTGSIFIEGDEVSGAEGWVSASLVDTEYDISSLPVVE